MIVLQNLSVTAESRINMFQKHNNTLVKLLYVCILMAICPTCLSIGWLTRSRTQYIHPHHDQEMQVNVSVFGLTDNEVIVSIDVQY